MRENLKQARKKAGFSQQTMAEKIGIHERYYKSLESGKRLGAIWIWDAIEDILGVNQRFLREIQSGTEDNL